jgi:hypothetical protein
MLEQLLLRQSRCPMFHPLYANGHNTNHLLATLYHPFAH